MAETQKEEKKEDVINEITLVIKGEENIKSFSILLASALQSGNGMAFVEVIADLKKQVLDQTKNPLKKV